MTDVPFHSGAYDLGALRGNARKVYWALKAAGRPLTAYQLIDALRDEGVSAPPTVYRALARLLDAALVHRIESTNAYVTCAGNHNHPEGETGSVMFAICDACGQATEVVDAGINADLARCAVAHDFALHHATLELHGRCGTCRKAASP